MKELLCIMYDNSAVTGEYFSNSHYQHHDQKFIDSQRKEHNFNLLYNRDTTVSSSQYDYSVEGSYLIGDYIPITTSRSSEDGLSTTKYSTASTLSLPAATDGGFCSSHNAVRFGINARTSCWTMIEDIENDCEQNLLLNIDNFVSNIHGEDFCRAMYS